MFCRRCVQCLFCLLFRERDSSCWKIWTVIFQVTCIISQAVIQYAGSEIICLLMVYSSFRTKCPSTHNMQQYCGALLMHHNLFLFIPVHQLSNCDGARMTSLQFIRPIVFGDKSLDLFLISSVAFLTLTSPLLQLAGLVCDERSLRFHSLSAI